MIGQVDIECTEHVRCPAGSRGLEAEARWVDQRNDRERCATIWQVDAANAAIVLDEDAQVVLVSDALGMTSRLDTCHHEAILGGYFLHHTLLLLLCLDFVLDLRHVETHGRLPLTLASVRPLHSLVDKLFAVGMAVETGPDSQDLLDKEADAVCVQLAIRVVNLDVALSDFIRQENILGEHRAHRAMTLVNAAPCLDVACFRLSITNDHVNWLLTDDQNLLEFHLIVLVMGLQNGLDIVLDLGLWLLS